MKLIKLGITHAVDLTNQKIAQRYDQRIKYFNIFGIDDNENANIKQYFEPAADFIKTAREAGGKILVYCAAGVSRSATIVITYLMIHEKFSLQEAYKEVVSKRFIISPNVGFWRQMKEYEEEKKGNTSIDLKAICYPDNKSLNTFKFDKKG